MMGRAAALAPLISPPRRTPYDGSKMHHLRASLAAAIILVAGVARAEEPVRLTAAVVPAIAAGGLYVAYEKGFFRAAGIELDIQDVNSGSDLQAMLATNRVQVISGAISAAMFNSMARDLPVKVFYTVGISPSFHYLMVRDDLKDAIRKPADLKGRSIAVSGRASGDYYGVARVLETGGLTFKDADVKTVGFSEMPAALQNKGIDVAVMIPPLTDAMVQRGLAVKWMDPEDVLTARPVLVAVGQMNTDWVESHEAATKAFLAAVLRGTREYCDAYHFGPNRAEVVGILAKYSSIHDAALIDRIEWGASDPIGEIPSASMADFQAFEVKENLTTTLLPLDRIARTDWIEQAGRALGPFKLTHDDGKPGCR